MEPIQREQEREHRQEQKTRTLTGGMILITLGGLIILHKMNLWVFSQSWPALLIVIALSILIQRAGDLAGWIIGGVGIFFLIAETLEVRIYPLVKFLFPIALILVGLNMLLRQSRKKDGKDGESDIRRI